MHVNKRILKDVLDSFLVFLVAVILFIGAIALMCVFGGEVMRVFGFQYSSLRSVIEFFVIGAIISWPVSLAAEALPKVLEASTRQKPTKSNSKRNAAPIHVSTPNRAGT